jgi:hypothetical protein
MGTGSFLANQLAVPAAQGVRGHQRRESFANRAQLLQDGEDNPFFRSDLGAFDLATENAHLLAEDQ